jgi:hypothetical protein
VQRAARRGRWVARLGLTKPRLRAFRARHCDCKCDCDVQRIIIHALFVLGAFLVSGCTLIGMGIGAAVPRYTPTEDPRPGDTVRATTVDGQVAVGEVESADARVLVLRGDARSRRVWSRESLSLLEERSSYLGLGAGVGFLIDALSTMAAFLIGYAVVQSWPCHSPMGCVGW